MNRTNEPISWALTLGGIGFALGFFGPMLLDPSSGNGPMLGIFITGPGGFILGLLFGWFRKWRANSASKAGRTGKAGTAGT